MTLAFSLLYLIFFSMKFVKNLRRANLENNTLHKWLVEIYIEEPPLSSFCPDVAIELWWSDCCTTRRLNQQPRKHISIVKQILERKMIYTVASRYPTILWTTTNLINPTSYKIVPYTLFQWNCRPFTKWSSVNCVGSR